MCIRDRVRIDKKDKKMGFFENQYDKFKTTEDWKTYTISGKIDNDAQLLHFGAFAQDNGDYYFCLLYTSRCV